MNKKVKLVIAAVASIFLLTSCATEPSVNNGSSNSKTVYTKPASDSMLEVDGEAAQINKTEGKYTLTISNVDNDTTWFTDRPIHEAGNTQTSNIPEIWAEGGDASLDALAPNASLTVKDNGKSETLVVEVTHPVLENNNLTFDMKPVKSFDTSLVGKTLSTPVLVIDSTVSDITLTKMGNDGKWITCVSSTMCDLYIVVTNTSNRNFLGAHQTNTPPWWQVDTMTLTIRAEGIPASVKDNPSYWSTSYSNGVLTATTTIALAAGASKTIHMSYWGDPVPDATILWCQSTFGTCGVN